MVPRFPSPTFPGGTRPPLPRWDFLAMPMLVLQHFFQGISVLKNVGFTKLKLLPATPWWGFSETVATLAKMF